MKKIFVLLILTAFVLGACITPSKPPAVDPETKPEITVVMLGEGDGDDKVFSLDADDLDAPQPVAAITVNHPVPIKEWTIQVQPIRQAGQGQTGQGQGERPARQEGERPARQEGAAGQEGAEGQPRQQRAARGPFYEEKGEGTPPTEWKWNGKSSRAPRQRQDGTTTPVERVQSATDYQLTVTVIDSFGNSSVYEGKIAVDVLVNRDANGDLRMIVPSIVFPPNSADFSLLSEQDQRGNARILRLVGRSLTKYGDYAITVEGHANPTTPEGTQARAAEQVGDLRLSQQRAQAVADYLVANQNIDRSRLTVVGIGNARTVADYDDDEENWKNRRVEFILHK